MLPDWTCANSATFHFFALIFASHLPLKKIFGTDVGPGEGEHIILDLRREPV